jgi:uncharacterized protein with HEPN domain
LPFREPAFSLRDILEDPKTVAAVERKHLLMGEAAVRLGDDADRLRPGLPWHNICGIGNWLRHRYDRVDIEMVWNTVIDDLFNQPSNPITID